MEENKNAKPQKLFGYEIRKPFDGENKYFKNNVNVAGMATEDGKIILNPFSKNTPEQQQSVAKNEALRLWMRDNKYEPNFEITQEQKDRFKGTLYAKPENEMALRHTLLARAMTGDSSSGEVTPEQREYMLWLSKKLNIQK